MTGLEWRAPVPIRRAVFWMVLSVWWVLGEAELVKHINILNVEYA